MAGDNPTLVVEDLKTYFFTKSGVVKAVDGAGFAVKRGNIMGLVGESGCGKNRYRFFHHRSGGFAR